MNGPLPNPMHELSVERVDSLDEADLAELEKEGAKADARRKVRESAEREMTQIRKRADQQIERLEQVWDRFKNLKVQDLEGDEILYREMRDRFGLYFEGGMGAAALQKRLENFDLDAEAELLREINRTRSVVVVEHDMDFVRALGVKVTVLHEGHVLSDGSIDHVSSDPRVIEVYLGR